MTGLGNEEEMLYGVRGGTGKPAWGQHVQRLAPWTPGGVLGLPLAPE